MNKKKKKKHWCEVYVTGGTDVYIFLYSVPVTEDLCNIAVRYAIRRRKLQKCEVNLKLENHIVLFVSVRT